jgi:hypothetical protein
MNQFQMPYRKLEFYMDGNGVYQELDWHIVSSILYI